MPLPRALGRFNARVTNRILGPVVTRLPGFVWLEHVGRRSGRTRSTPVLLFGSGATRVIALTYGPDTDWARNLIAAGRGVAIDRSARRLVLIEPRLVHDDRRRLVPRWVRLPLWALGVSDFLVVDVELPA